MAELGDDAAVSRGAIGHAVGSDTSPHRARVLDKAVVEM